jgi:hypothetical protein
MILINATEYAGEFFGSLDYNFTLTITYSVIQGVSSLIYACGFIRKKFYKNHVLFLHQSLK